MAIKESNLQYHLRMANVAVNAGNTEQATVHLLLALEWMVEQLSAQQARAADICHCGPEKYHYEHEQDPYCSKCGGKCRLAQPLASIL